MDPINALFVWLSQPARWQGVDSIPNRISEHLLMSGVTLLISLVLAMPIALYLGHIGRGANLAINIANVGRAIPSLAFLAFALPISFAFGLGLGFWPTVIALVPLAFPLLFVNTITAMREVDADILEAARAMGLSGWQVFQNVELPLGAPLILAGIRNATVGIVATATLGALVAGGGLGRFLIDGLARRENERLITGAILVAVLAIFVEVFFSVLERIARPKQGEIESQETVTSTAH